MISRILLLLLFEAPVLLFFPSAAKSTLLRASEGSCGVLSARPLPVCPRQLESSRWPSPGNVSSRWVDRLVIPHLDQHFIFKATSLSSF